MTALTSIRNIGPAFETELQRAGIDTAEELREIGAHDAYARMVEAGAKPHFIGYYVLHMALQGRPWSDCKGAEKDQLRIAFDNLKSEKTDPARSEIEAFMNRIGVISSPS